MRDSLEGLTVAVLATDGFEESELRAPRKALEAAGARTLVVSPKAGHIEGRRRGERGQAVKVDETLARADAGRYDALLLPGGLANPDRLRMDRAAVAFVKAFAEAGKPIASICHGPWTLIEADAVKGRHVTSWPSLKTDLRNAGAFWEDSEVVVDGGLVTSRGPGDLPAFNAKMVEVFAAGRQVALAGRTAYSPPHHRGR